tara:strand:- start:245 stop:934 length:690 start_codon:yes stop_codon:yes gene_type:complete
MEDFFATVIEFFNENIAMLLVLLVLLVLFVFISLKFFQIFRQLNKYDLSTIEHISYQAFQTRAMPYLAEGRAYHNIPSKMERSKPYSVSVALSPMWNSKIFERMLGDGALQSKKVELSEYMEVNMNGIGFNIVPGSTKEQLITDGAVWNFNITPLQSGAGKIHICITIKTQCNGKESSKDMDTVSWDVIVNISHYTVGLFLKKNWKWAIATCFATVGLIFTYLKYFGGE